MTAARIEPADAERLCLDAIDLVELFSLGEDVGSAATPDTVTGLVLYCQLLEATLGATSRAAAAKLYAVTGDAGDLAHTDIEAVRAAARGTATAWRAR